MRNQIDRKVFLLFGAGIQMIDDWEALENDLAVGLFSYATLGHETLHDIKDEDKGRVHNTHDRSKGMIAEARSILTKLDDHFLIPW